MKKTIITILALASSTLAGTVSTGSTDKTEAIIATSALTLSQLTTIIETDGTATALLGVKDSGNNVWSISVNTWNPRNELHIYAVEAGASVSGAATNSFSDASDWPAGHDIKSAFDLTGAVSGAITLGYQGANVTGNTVSGTSVVLSVLYDNGSIQTIYGNCAGHKYSNNYITEVSYADALTGTPNVSVSTTPWTKDSLIAANEAVLIPEPATATLSLLALAGLAARRRRK